MSDFSDHQHQQQQHHHSSSSSSSLSHYEHEQQQLPPNQHSTSLANAIPSYNDTSHFYTSSNPGAINIAFGSAMMGSMLIFFLWMCYFCRCKDPKPEDDSSTVSSANQPYPYWIDIPDDNDTEERITICDDNEIYESLRSHLSNCVVEERLPTPPPTYDALFKPPPTYEDALKEIKQETSSSTVSKKTAAPEPEVYIIR